MILTTPKKFLDSLRRRFVRTASSLNRLQREFSDDQRTKGYGGYFTDADGGIKVSIKELDPIVYFTIDSMKEGTISRPIVLPHGRPERRRQDIVL